MLPKKDQKGENQCLGRWLSGQKHSLSKHGDLSPDPSIYAQLGMATSTCNLSTVECETGGPLRPAGYQLSSGVIKEPPPHGGKSQH